MCSDDVRVYALPGPHCDVRPAELIALWTATGWGSADRYSHEDCRRALLGTTAVVAARNSAGTLLGCARLLSDGVYYTTVADVVVHPAYRRRGIGRALLACALAQYGATGVFCEVFPEAREFFAACGFRRRELEVMAGRCTVSDGRHDT